MGAAIQPWITALLGPVMMITAFVIWRYRDTTDERIKALDTKIDTKIDALDLKLNTKIDTKFDALDTKFEAKFDALSKLLTENLIVLNREIGEIKGASHTHTPSS